MIILFVFADEYVFQNINKMQTNTILQPYFLPARVVHFFAQRDSDCSIICLSLNDECIN